MAKKHSKRNNVNWGNPKVQSVVSYLQLGENRITKAEIYTLSNKDIFYQLKNSGYIKETTKGAFIGTAKLHKHIKESEGSCFSSSSSTEHSQALRRSLSLIPKSTLEQRHFRSSVDIEKRFNRSIKNSSLYKAELASMRKDCQTKLSSLESEHQNFLSVPHTATEIWNEKACYQKERETLYQSLHILEEKPYLVPDYQITLTKTELSDYISNLEHYSETLTEHSRAEELYADSIGKLKEIYSQMDFTANITINIEIVTDTYGNREIVQHQNFEHFSATPQIFLM